MIPRLRSELVALDPALVIFDKDGTLIDFNAMWGAWLTELAQKLEQAARRSIAAQLFSVLGFDPDSGRIDPYGHLAITPMAILQELTVEVIVKAALSGPAAEALVTAVWQPPDPVELAYPLADLPGLFNNLKACGLHIAVATTDDRAPTIATLAKLGLDAWVTAIICADEGTPVKPAPDMVLAVCQALSVSPAKTIVVGDTIADLQMGRAAGVGLVVGVLSGVSPASVLAPYADILLPSVADLIEPHPAA